MPDWTIRRAEPGDAPALAACIEAAYAVYEGRVPDLPDVSGGIADDIRDNLVWVAVRGEAVVGGLVLIRQPDHMVLANVAVAPAASGMGLGRAFLDLSEAQCRELGIGELRLSTHVDMPENVRLYEHLGWRETGRAGSKVHMSKTVTG